MNNVNNTLRATELFRAAKSRSQGRRGWCVIFRHPLLRDARNRPVRMRRGLATRDENEAERLVEEMNRLMGDETYWTGSARERAAGELDPRVIAIFYDHPRPLDRQLLDEGHGKVIPLRF